MKLVICEKPNAAEKIASAIASAGKKKAERRAFGKASYWQTEFGGEKITVVSAVGHLYSLRQAGAGQYPVFDVEWAPAYEVDEEAGFQKPYLEAIKKLSEGAEEYVCACDFDTEGTLIGYNILRFACRAEKASRMKFSTLVQEELQSAWLNRGKFDLENALAGEARHILDWFYGINLSRVLMACLRAASGKNQVMSIGRVQGPALALLAKREKEIASFVPSPYWEVSCKCKGVKFENSKGRFLKKEEAELALSSSQKEGVVEKIEKKEQLQPPPPPFDLTSLQLEAHRAFGMEPKATLEAAQRLYESALISYPRTGSQKLPATLNLKKIISMLSEDQHYLAHARKLLEAGRLKPQEGKKEDPAHPAIHPTGQRPKEELGKLDARIYDLIVRRFLACFGEPAKRESQKIRIKSGFQQYSASGVRTISQGWFEAYLPYLKLEEAAMPPFFEGEKVQLSEFALEEKKTQPPKRYTSASIVAELEKRGLGTKATRAAIVETLFKRGYVEGESIAVTPFGMAVYELLSKSAPEILDEKLTRDIESEMERIKDGESEKSVIGKGKAYLVRIIKKFSGKEREIGLELLVGLRKKESGVVEIGACPKCGSQMRIITMQTGRQFIGCGNYPACKNAYPIPSGVKAAGSGEVCPYCKAPIIKGFLKGKLAFKICPNPSCKQEDGQAESPSEASHAARKALKRKGKEKE
ncbi:MAG: DNA topoisomerase I [Candidatus Micrarchaeota archaeon]|nr:DNA topoisomerase I [Candidatus Micrarchaeota archaeon]